TPVAAVVAEPPPAEQPAPADTTDRGAEPETRPAAEERPSRPEPRPESRENREGGGRDRERGGDRDKPGDRDGRGDGRGNRDRMAANSINIAKLQAMSMAELNQMAKDLNVENFGTMRKHEVIFHILQKNAERSGVLFSEGVLEVLPEGFGFLRSQSFNYLPCPEDIYVSPSQIRRFDLQTGNLIAGQIRPPKEKERFFALLKVEAVDQEEPDKAKDK